MQRDGYHSINAGGVKLADKFIIEQKAKGSGKKSAVFIFVAMYKFQHGS
jgi:hypothetical protein